MNDKNYEIRISRILIITFFILVILFIPIIGLSLFCFFLFWKSYYIKTFIPKSLKIYTDSLESNNAFETMYKMKPALRCKLLLIIMVFLARNHRLYKSDKSKFVGQIQEQSDIAIFIFPFILYVKWELNQFKNKLNYE